MSVSLSPEEYAKRHQKAFRCAFDFLNDHFPPGSDDEWWLKAAQDVADACHSQGSDRLAIGLLQGVYDYLSSECRTREDNTDG